MTKFLTCKCVLRQPLRLSITAHSDCQACGHVASFEDKEVVFPYIYIINRCCTIVVVGK